MQRDEGLDLHKMIFAERDVFFLHINKSANFRDVTKSPRYLFADFSWSCFLLLLLLWLLLVHRRERKYAQRRNGAEKIA